MNDKESIPTTQSVINFCGGSEMPEQVEQIITGLEMSEENSELAQQFYEDHMVELYRMALEFSLEKKPHKLTEDEIREVDEEFKNQLSLWWLEMQSEWIRFNNLLNFKTAVLGATDQILQAKASICSYFLQPVAELLDTQKVSMNVKQLKNLVKRAKFTSSE